MCACARAPRACARVRARVRTRVCVRACACAHVRARVCVRACVCARACAGVRVRVPALRVGVRMCRLENLFRVTSMFYFLFDSERLTGLFPTAIGC